MACAAAFIEAAVRSAIHNLAVGVWRRSERERAIGRENRSFEGAIIKILPMFRGRGGIMREIAFTLRNDLLQVAIAYVGVAFVV